MATLGGHHGMLPERDQIAACYEKNGATFGLFRVGLVGGGEQELNPPL